jgi:hypothetical protein
MEEMRNAYKILIGNSQMKSLGDQRIDGNLILKRILRKCGERLFT